MQKTPEYLAAMPPNAEQEAFNNQNKDMPLIFKLGFFWGVVTGFILSALGALLFV